MTNLIASSKTHPCPVCDRTKDGDCRTGEGKNLVLCHTHSMGNGALINGYRFCGQSDDGLWGQWGWVGEKGLKNDRPSSASITYYNYPARNGSPLIRVARKDGINNSKSFWQEYVVDGVWLSAGKVPNASKADARKRVPIYRYAEVQTAIDSGNVVVWVEGEKVADALWEIGIPATTSIGGSAAFERWGDYTQDLKAAHVAVSPDWDKEGFKYAAKVSEAFGITRWILPFSKSYRWTLVMPKNHGLDLADQIKDGATKDELLAAIAPVDFERFNAGDGVETETATAAATGGNAVVSISGNGQNPYGSKDVGVGYGVSTKRDIEELLESLKEMRGIEAVKSDRLDPYKLFPYELANALERAAAVLPCPVEALITALLSVCSTLVGTSSRVSISQTWHECLVFWGMISGPTGSMKSTTLSLVTTPLVKMQAQAEYRYIQAMEQWSLSKRDAEKNKEEFDDPEPLKREYYIDDATFEAVGQTHKENPRGMLLLQEEIDSFYSSMNKHRSGKGDDQQRWLSLNGGSAIKVNRLSRKLFIEKTSVGIIGTIQPDTVLPILRDQRNNVSGMNSRWNYCNVAFPSALNGTDDPESIIELQELLLTLYERLLTLPGGDVNEYGNIEQTSYLFDGDAYNFFHTEWKPPIVRACESEQHPGYKGVLAKQRGFAGRNAALLHLIGSVVDNRMPSKLIPLDRARGGVAIAQFFCNQAKELYGIAGIESEDMDWTPVLIRLKEASIAVAAADGWISPRDAKRKTRLVRSSDHAKSIFAQLHEAGIGELDTSAPTPRWRWVDRVETKDGADTVANVDTLRTDWLLDVAANVDKGVAAAAAVDAVDNKDENQSFPPKSKPVKKESPTDSTEPLKVGDEVVITVDRLNSHPRSIKNAVGIIQELKVEVDGDTLYHVTDPALDFPELAFDDWFNSSEIKCYQKASWQTWQPN